MRKVTAQEIEEAMTKTGQGTVIYSECSMCHSPLMYQYWCGALHLETNCGCTRYSSEYRTQRTWGDAATLINMQDEGEPRRKMAKAFYLDIDSNV